MEVLLEYFSKGILVMLAITMPCICTAAAIGLVVGILQAVTQVQEQTIAAAPKVLAVFLVILLGGVGFIRMLTNVFYEGTDIAFKVVPKNDNYVLASEYYKYTKPFSEEMQTSFSINKGKVKKVFENPENTPFMENGKSFKTYSTSNQEIPTPNYIESRKIQGN